MAPRVLFPRPLLVAAVAIVVAVRPMSAQISPAAPNASSGADQPDSTVGLTEKLGQVIPLDLAFYDDRGSPRALRDLIDRPTILVLVFYHCSGACGMIQGSVATIVPDIPFKLGKDYRIVTISFDDEETPELAAETRSNFTAAVRGGVPDDGWPFLTGSVSNIQAICSAVGFRARKEGRHNFVHPNLITVLSKDGKIIRYLYGTSYLPLDVGMALSEASRGTPGISIKKMMSFCFQYDPSKRRYTFTVFRVFGATTLLVAAVFLFFLLRKGRTRADPPGPPPS